MNRLIPKTMCPVILSTLISISPHLFSMDFEDDGWIVVGKDDSPPAGAPTHAPNIGYALTMLGLGRSQALAPIAPSAGARSIKEHVDEYSHAGARRLLSSKTTSETNDGATDPVATPLRTPTPRYGGRCISIELLEESIKKPSASAPSTPTAAKLTFKSMFKSSERTLAEKQQETAAAKKISTPEELKQEVKRCCESAKEIADIPMKKKLFRHAINCLYKAADLYLTRHEPLEANNALALAKDIEMRDLIPLEQTIGKSTFKSS